MSIKVKIFILGVISIFGFILMFVTTQVSEKVIIRLMQDNEVLLLMLVAHESGQRSVLSSDTMTEHRRTA
jgi:hypothetical protein